MNVKRKCFRYCVCIVLGMPLVASANDTAGELRVAVASNFMQAFTELAQAFEAQTDYAVKASSGSTGKLYAQIVNGAPFDVLLAADTLRPHKLEQSGSAVGGSRFTYAVGRLVLWSRDSTVPADGCVDALKDPQGRVAIANPRSAPYGAAARETLEALGLWATVEKRLVIGENVAQALHFTASGGARIGFLAASQMTTARLPVSTCTWAVPGRYHKPIEQQAVRLAGAKNATAAKRFMVFLRSAEARRIVRDHGYGVTG